MMLLCFQRLSNQRLNELSDEALKTLPGRLSHWSVTRHLMDDCFTVVLQGTLFMVNW